MPPKVPGGPVPPVDVVLVAGTRTRLAQLERLLAGPEIVVTGVARDAATAEQLVRTLLPGAVLVDLDLFGGGLDAIERIMAGRPTPVVVCGAAAQHPEAALAAGAVDVVGTLDVPASAPEYAGSLRRHLRIASRVTVITHPRARLRARGDVRRSTPTPIRASRTVVAIGASTGGPPALATILGGLPADLPAAVLVVQHMAEGFVEGLARWLDGVCALRVVVAVDGEHLEPGGVYLAPAGQNLILRPGPRVHLQPPEVGQFHVPGIDVTFRSVAGLCGRDSVGVLLTGMGRDGAAGLRDLRLAGGFTIGQDEASSVVWGMPAAAQAMDAVDVELPLGEVGPAIVAAVGVSPTPPRSAQPTPTQAPPAATAPTAPVDEVVR